mgnify:CR=1 FL=1
MFRRIAVITLVIAIVAIKLLYPTLTELLATHNAVSFDSSPLHIAAKSGEMGKIDVALRSCASINQKDEFGKTALHYAAEFGHPQTTKSLLLKGSDARIRDLQGYTALQHALGKNHGQTAGLLAEAP